MPAETIEQKAHRILIEGRLTVLRVDATGGVRATCKSLTGQVYSLGYRIDEKRWGCTCEASRTFNRRCKHVVALQLVTVAPQEDEF